MPTIFNRSCAAAFAVLALTLVMAQACTVQQSAGGNNPPGANGSTFSAVAGGY